MSETLRLKAIRRVLPELRSISVLGVGSGSTVSLFIECLAEDSEARKRLVAIPASTKTSSLLEQHGFRTSSFSRVKSVDAVVDGVDEITRRLDLLKGGGGALAREKILASATRRMVVIADETKVVKRLGERHKLPVEILPYARGAVENSLQELGLTDISLRHDSRRQALFITDNGNYILDAKMPASANLTLLGRALDLIPGLVEHGLFLRLANVAYIGTKSGVEIWKRK